MRDTGDFLKCGSVNPATTTANSPRTFAKVNAFWVHFEAFQADGDQLKAVPLLDAMKGVGEHRFLTGSSRDFFYITTK